MSIAELLGVAYDSVDEAVDNLKQDEIVVTNNDETFYCVKSELFFEKLQSLGYEIVQ